MFKMECLLRPSYELSSYEPVSVKVPEKQAVTSKDVTAYLDNMSKELATWEQELLSLLQATPNTSTAYHALEGIEGRQHPDTLLR